ncbi:OsmC family protein [Chitinispirillales bacterium ANBcel5]|uniref:OsmC family protein n=1 Tax=Cellulosispirillum alkaliphilum TaxID=3039283 RepID=UPI002A51E41F|nr:OsmC family protein [Chitinispirillales bacterium ANBcel5]
MPDLKFSVSAQALSPAKTEVKTRKFSFIIDEPKELGGTNEAANPVEYLLGSLAGCINVVGHLVAKEQNITLSNLKVEISGNLNPEKLFGKATEDRTGYKEISVKLYPETDASPEVLSKWIEEIEKRCPINDNITNSTPVKVSVGADTASTTTA